MLLEGDSDRQPLCEMLQDFRNRCFVKILRLLLCELCDSVCRTVCVCILHVVESLPPHEGSFNELREENKCGID